MDGVCGSGFRFISTGFFFFLGKLISTASLRDKSTMISSTAHVSLSRSYIVPLEIDVIFVGFNN